jgi:negative regulator of sigma-B (phosphoserine phosphatase)
LRFGIASRPASGMHVNGDAYFVKEWDGQTVMAVIDGLGHGAEASTVSEKTREFLATNYSENPKQIILALHAHLGNKSRGVAAELVRIEAVEGHLLFCGIGNTEVRIISEPPMHPASLDGILGLNLRKAVEFEYPYRSLKAVVLHSDGISSRFELSDYPSLYEQPQEVADQIMAKWGKDHDDATIVIAVEDDYP